MQGAGDDWPRRLEEALPRIHDGSQHVIADARGREVTDNHDIDFLGQFNNKSTGLPTEYTIANAIFSRDLRDQRDDIGTLDAVNFGSTDRARLIRQNSGPRSEIQNDIAGPNDLADRITISRHRYRISNTPLMIFQKIRCHNSQQASYYCNARLQRQCRIQRDSTARHFEIT
jgi:hypothetical protein